MRATRRTGRRGRWCAAVAVVLALTACGEAAPSDPQAAADPAASAPPAATGPADAATPGGVAEASDPVSGASDPATGASSVSATGLDGATLHGVAGGAGGPLVAVGSDGTSAAAWTAADEGWQRGDVEDADEIDRLRAVASGAGGFVAFGGGDDQPSTGWTSDDGTVWTPAEATGVDVRVNAVAADGDGWIAVGDRIAPEGGGTEAGVVLTSADGVTWELATDRLRVGDGTVSDVAVGDDGTVVAVGFDTAGGRIWRNPASRRRPVDADAAGTTIQGVAVATDGFVALGRAVGDLHPVVWTSADGRTWERRDLDTDVFPPTDEVNDLTGTDAGLVAAGGAPGGGVLWTSTDGLEWTRSGP